MTKYEIEISDEIDAQLKAAGVDIAEALQAAMTQVVPMLLQIVAMQRAGVITKEEAITDLIVLGENVGRNAKANDESSELEVSG